MYNLPLEKKQGRRLSFVLFLFQIRDVLYTGLFFIQNDFDKSLPVSIFSVTMNQQKDNRK